MLPDGFEWNEWSGPDQHVELTLNGQAIAAVTVVPNGAARIRQHPGNAHRRYSFQRNRASAMAYLERWAWLWADQLREQYPRPTMKPIPPLPPEWVDPWWLQPTPRP